MWRSRFEKTARLSIRASWRRRQWWAHAHHWTPYRCTSGVPGGLGSQPLHKGTKELETENRDITCKDNPRVPSPRPQGRDCDEYPFASSGEGGTFGGAERTFGAGCLLPDVATGVTGPGYSICLISVTRCGTRSARGGLASDAAGRRPSEL